MSNAFVDAGLPRLRADVVAVVERHRAPRAQREHRAHVLGHGGHRSRDVVGRAAVAQTVRFVERHAVGDVAVQRIVRRRLIRQHVGRDAARDERRQDVGRVRAQSDRPCHAVACPAGDRVERLVQAVGRLVQVACGQAPLDAPGIHLDHQRRGAVHRRGQRLGSAHAAETGGDDEAPGQRAAEMTTRDLGQRLVGPLHDALAADVDPAAGRHLAVHRQAALLEIAEVLPRRPRGNEQRVGDEHARRAGMGLKDADRLAGLDQQRLVVLERLQRPDDGVVGVPVARRLSRSAVHHQIVGPLGDVGIEIVHQHPHARLPAASLCRSARCRAAIGWCELRWP